MQSAALASGNRSEPTDANDYKLVETVQRLHKITLTNDILKAIYHYN